MLTREQIDAAVAAGCPREPVPVPEFGGDVLVRGMTAKELNAFQIWYEDNKQRGRPNAIARIIAATICDENGARLYKDTDIPAIGEWPSIVMAKLLPVSKRLSGINDDSEEEIEKNSEGAQTDNGGS